MFIDSVISAINLMYSTPALDTRNLAVFHFDSMQVDDDLLLSVLGRFNGIEVRSSMEF